MSDTQLPRTPVDVTPSWLTRALRRTVVSESSSVIAIESEPIGAGTGFSGSLVRLRLRYDQTEEHHVQ